MADSHIKKIVLVGAGGNAGSSILKALLAAKRFDVTILSRPESKSTFPEGVKVVKGSYDDADFLVETFTGADALIITLGFAASAQQPELIEAALTAGVPWIIPNEYAGDGTNQAMVERVPVLAHKQEIREAIARRGGVYIGVATGPWTEMSLHIGGVQIDIPNKTYTRLSGTGRYNHSAIEQVGKGVAALLSLPIKNDKEPRRSLEHYANSFVYISSLHTTQEELFEAVKRATGTSDADWTIKQSDVHALLKEADAGLAAGQMQAMLMNVFGNYMGEGLGGDVETKAAEDREVLGLETGDLDTIVRGALAAPA